MYPPARTLSRCEDVSCERRDGAKEFAIDLHGPRRRDEHERSPRINHSVYLFTHCQPSTALWSAPITISLGAMTSFSHHKS